MLKSGGKTDYQKDRPKMKLCRSSDRQKKIISEKSVSHFILSMCSITLWCWYTIILNILSFHLALNVNVFVLIFHFSCKYVHIFLFGSHNWIYFTLVPFSFSPFKCDNHEKYIWIKIAANLGCRSDKLWPVVLGCQQIARDYEVRIKEMMCSIMWVGILMQG